jgi:hypothetical protein
LDKSTNSCEAKRLFIATEKESSKIVKAASACNLGNLLEPSVYTGKATGFYAGDISAAGDPAHTSYFVDADVSLTANFANSSITFATANSILTSDFDQAYSDATNLLDLTGTLTINGTNFTGNVSNNNLLSGSATGRFYGDASEVGGTFLVQEAGAGSNKDTYMGAFGASSL